METSSTPSKTRKTKGTARDAQITNPPRKVVGHVRNSTVLTPERISHAKGYRTDKAYMEETKRIDRPLSENEQERVEGALRKWLEGGQGRRTILHNKEFVDNVMRYIDMGSKIGDSLEASGASRSNWSNWQKNADHGIQPYLAFVQEIEKRRLSYKSKLVGVITSHAPKNWTAAAWLLERQWQDEFAIKNKVEVSNSEGKPFQTETTTKMKIEDLTLEQKKLLLQLSSTLIEKKGD